MAVSQVFPTGLSLCVRLAKSQEELVYSVCLCPFRDPEVPHKGVDNVRR